MNCLVLLLLTIFCVVSALPLTKRSQTSARAIQTSACFTSVTTEGVISSGRSTSRGGKFGIYAPNLDCSWSIQAPEGQRVRLHFDIFVVQRNWDCGFDYVQIFDGDSPSSPRFGPPRMCGHRPNDKYFPDSPFVSTGRNMFLVFKTNERIEQRGWDATVNFLGNSGTFQPAPMTTFAGPIANI